MGSPYTVMAQVLACLCEQLADRPVCFCGMVLGTQLIPADACLCNASGDKCGTAWVRLDSTWASSDFPVQDMSPRGSCTSPLAYRIHVGVARCQPLPDGSGRPPSVDALNLAAQRMIDDQRAAYRALQCCSVWGRGESLLGGWANVGTPDGGCAGGFWAFTWWDTR